MNSKNQPLKIVIVGAGGFGREVLSTLYDCNKQNKKYNITGFVDEKKSLEGQMINGITVLGGLDWFVTKIGLTVNCVVAIGDSIVRQKVVKKLEKLNVKFTTIIHPSVTLSKFVELGEGTIIQAGSIIMPNTKLGKHVIINMDCSIAHDCNLNDYVTLSPGAHINGDNILERGVYVGAGTVTKDELRIRKWSIIGAGTVLIKNVPEYALYVGVPGKLKKKVKTMKSRPKL